MELSLISVPGRDTKSTAIQLADSVFGCEFKEALIHQVVTAYKAAGRAGTRAQKTRAEVSGGGIKPWKQKGTGRARAGTTRGPIWRKGGVTFAAKPQCYAQKVNKKMYQNAMRSIFSELIRSNRLVAVENFEIESPRTKLLLETLHQMNLNEVLILTDKVDMNLFLAARNLFKVDVRDVAGIDPVSLIGFEKVLVTLPALKQIEEVLG